MEKYVVFVVDGTVATAPYWVNIVSDYVEKIIRGISRETDQGMLFLGLVVYKAHGRKISDSTVEAFNWTSDVNMFQLQLSALNFSSGGGLCDAAIAEGLAEALMLYAKPKAGDHESVLAQRASAKKHCVLVAASNPYELPKRLWLPIMENGQFKDLQMEFPSVVVNDIARMFAESSVSLSVISPKDFRRLREIFNLGNGIKLEEVFSSSTKNILEYDPQKYLVLLSEKFPEIHSIFKEEEMMTILRTSPLPTSHEGRSNFMEEEIASEIGQLTDDDMMFLQRLMNDPTYINLEDYNFPDETFTAMPVGEIGSQPVMLSTGIRPGPIQGFPSTVVQPLPGSLIYSQAPGLAGNFRDPQAAASDFGSLTFPEATVSAVPGLYGNLSVPQAAVSTAPCLAAGPKAPQAATLTATDLSGDPRAPEAAAFKYPDLGGDLRAPHVAASAAPGLARNLRDSQASSSGSTDVRHPSSVNEYLQPRQTPGQVDQQGIYGNNQSAFIGSSTLGSVIHREFLETEQDGYVLSWKGNINMDYRRKTYCLGEAKAYRRLTAPSALTDDWPQTISFVRFIEQQSLCAQPYSGRVNILLIEAMANLRFYERMMNVEYCIRVDLPSQTMLLFPTTTERLFYSVLFGWRLPPSGPETPPRE